MLTCWCGEVLLLLADMFFVLHPGSALGENGLRQDLTLDGGLTSSLGPRSSFVLGGGQTPPPCHCTPPQSVLLSFHVLWKPQVWQNSRGHRRQSCWTLPPRRMNHSSLCHVLKNEDPILLENRLLFLPWKSRSRLGIKKWKEKKKQQQQISGIKWKYSIDWDDVDDIQIFYSLVSVTVQPSSSSLMTTRMCGDSQP